MAELNPEFNNVMIKGHSAAWEQNWEDAASLYRKAVSANPSNTMAITSLGLAFYEQKKFKEALICYSRASKLSPEDPISTEKMANIYEEIGEIKKSIEMSMRTADLHLKLRDTEKAIENWKRVTRLKPEHLKAHSRLAVVQDKLGRKKLAIQEYIILGAYLQEIGQVNQALMVIKKAVEADPFSKDAIQALHLIENNKTLPIPSLVVFKEKSKFVREPRKDKISNAFPIDLEKPDPIGEARQKALTALAGKLFDITDENIEIRENSNTGFLIKKDLGKNLEDDNLNDISIHLSAAIDFQTRANDEQAASELEQAISHGFNFPAAYFNLGLLFHRMGQKENAQPHLLHSTTELDYAMASHLLIAEYNLGLDNINEATVDYLRALKIADLSVVTPDLIDILDEQYEKLIDSTYDNEDLESLKNLSNNIVGVLLQPDWKQQVKQARSQLPSAITGTLGVSLADLLIQAENTEMIQTMSSVYHIARQGYFRSAMEEAYNILSIAPSYLPLHIYMGELLLRQDRTKEAVKKFNTVAATFSARGEDDRSIELLKRVIDIVPLELSVRYRLIQQYIDQNRITDAVSEYMKLADVNYSLAKLDAARINYESALILAEKSDIEASLKTKILHQVADIDMQQLDWRQAEKIYEQIGKIDPEDELARIHLIEINLRLGNRTQSEFELDNYLFYLSTHGNDEDAIEFVIKIIKSNPDMLYARKALAEIYQQIGQSGDAIQQWDKLAEIAVERGDNEAAKEAIRAILMLNPENPSKYRLLLQNLG